jgi:hypothetical protein
VLLGEVSCLILLLSGPRCPFEPTDLSSLIFLDEVWRGYFLFLEGLAMGLVLLASLRRCVLELFFSIALPTLLVIETIKL